MRIIVFGDICPIKGDMSFDISCNGDDLLIGNLECPLTDNPKPVKKAGPVLYCQSTLASKLRTVGFYGVSLANNHIRDSGDDGVFNTIKVCEASGLRIFGAGATQESALEPLIIEKDGLKVGLISFAEREFNYAKKGKAGAAVFDPYDSFDRISELKQSVDAVIVLYHGGIEHYIYPTPLLQKKCRKMVDAGADVVLCQHSHCIGTRENYNGGEILYGQGNSVFGYRKGDDSWNYGLIVKLNLSKTNLNVEYDVLENKPDGSVSLVESEVRRKILESLERQSSKIHNPEFIESEWVKFCKEHESLYMPLLLGFGKNTNRLNRLLGNAVVRLFYNKRQLNVIHNIIRCDAHEEVLETILEQYNFE